MPRQLHQKEYDKGSAGGEPVAHDPLIAGQPTGAHGDRVEARAEAEREERERLQAMAAQQDRMSSLHHDASSRSTDRNAEASSIQGRHEEDTTAESTAIAVAVGVGAALIKTQWIPGILIGAGAVLLGRMYPRMGAYIRPAVKAMVSTGLTMTEQVREMAAEVGEQMQGVIDEVQSERERERNKMHDTATQRDRSADAERDARETATAP